MNTTQMVSFRVTDAQGTHLATLAAGELLAVKALVDANPGATVKALVDYTPCAEHAAFEAGNCPACGTAAVLA